MVTVGAFERLEDPETPVYQVGSTTLLKEARGEGEGGRLSEQKSKKLGLGLRKRNPKFTRTCSRLASGAGGVSLGCRT